MDKANLLDMAVKAAKNSYSPYSGFAVGAALLGKSGRIYTGCNIENSSFSATVCAERTAFFKAYSEGESEFTAIAVIGGKNMDFSCECMPCGVCRQVMAEFCGKDFQIITSENEYTLGELLPGAFNLDNIM
ncbi:cytidine deaminase [bacterium]|nr:cytidine deaminase [bacterium]